jgi:hypothetical protein
VAPAIVVVAGLIIFGVVFALNSAVHSYLILAYTDSDKVAMSVGFYYMANAAGRLAGTVLSGPSISGVCKADRATVWSPACGRRRPSFLLPACCRCSCHATRPAEQADQARRPRGLGLSTDRPVGRTFN